MSAPKRHADMKPAISKSQYHTLVNPHMLRRRHSKESYIRYMAVCKLMSSLFVFTPETEKMK